MIYVVLNLTLCILLQTDLLLDNLHHFPGRRTRMELHRMVLPIHEVEPRVDRSSIDRTHDLLPTRRPLPSTGALGLEETLLGEPRVLAFLANEIASTTFQMAYQIFPNYFLRGKDNATGQREQCPVAEVNARVRIRMVGRLLDQLQIEFVQQRFLAHATIHDRLDQGDVFVLSALHSFT